jgi:hypothetical protein
LFTAFFDRMKQKPHSAQQIKGRQFASIPIARDL